MRTIPDISRLLRPLDDAIDSFIKVMFNNYEFNTIERKLWSLPVRKGGMGLIIPSEISDDQYMNSRTIDKALISNVYNQQKTYTDIDANAMKAKHQIKKKNPRMKNFFLR